MSRNRGVSALRRTGPRKSQTLSVKVADLPKPVTDPSRRSEVQVDPNHGLWDFFYPQRTAIASIEYVNAHGRAWTLAELRKKDWEDLHRLWWVCVKERNRIATNEFERQRLKAGYGEYESEQRDTEVRFTMTRIKEVLTERFYAWQQARRLAERDPEVRLEPSDDQPAYVEGRKVGENVSFLIRSHLMFIQVLENGQRATPPDKELKTRMARAAKLALRKELNAEERDSQEQNSQVA